MLRHRIAIADRDYLLREHADLEALRQQTLEALKAGAGFITLDVVGHEAVTVAISPGVPVVFESQDVDYDLDAERDASDVVYASFAETAAAADGGEGDGDGNKHDA